MKRGCALLQLGRRIDIASVCVHSGLTQYLDGFVA
jgi:hypothetical protein